MKTILVPEYMAKFHCLGSACETNCCDYDWLIVIDKATYQKYLDLNDSILSPKFKNCFELIPDTSSDYYYAKLVKESNGKCPFQTEAGYCAIHQKLGPEYLCGTCNTYPRVVNIVNQELEMSGLTSCPEIARLLFFDSYPIRFTHMEYSSDAQFVYEVFNTDGWKSKWQFYTLNIRNLIMEILQDHTASLTDRLIFTGLFFQKLKDFIEQSKTEMVPMLISQFQTLLKNGGPKDIGQNINKNIPLQYELLKAICEIKAVESPKYRELFSKVLTGFKEASDTQGGDSANYEEILGCYYLKSRETNDCIFENYLVNYIFGKIYLFHDYDNPFEVFAAIIIHYSFMRFHLIGMAILQKKMDNNLIINTFMEVSRFIEHDNSFLRKIFQFLRERDCFTLAHMAILIKY